MDASREKFSPLLFPTKEFKPRIERADYPFVCMNNKGSVVMLYQSDGRVNYVVGELAVEQAASTHRIEWGKVQLYGDGCNVRAALNDNNEIVIVRSCKYRRQCRYRVGKVNPSDKVIEWWQNEHTLSQGVNPTVTLNDSTVLFVYEASFGSYRSFCEICRLQEGELLAVRDGRKPQQLSALNGYKEISVAVNKANQVVFSCRGFFYFDYKLYYAVGDLTATGVINITVVDTSYQYASGLYSHVCLLDNDTVLSVHSSGSQVMYTLGSMHDRAIQWEEHKELDHGFKPSVSLSDK